MLFRLVILAWSGSRTSYDRMRHINVPNFIFLDEMLPLNIRFGVIGLVFKESDIHGGVEAFGNKRIAFVPFFVWRVPKEDTLECFGIGFTSILLVDMDKHSAPKYSEWYGGDQLGVRIRLKKKLTRSLKF